MSQNIHEPTVFAYVYLRGSAAVADDNRRAILKQFDCFADKYHLGACNEYPYKRATDVSLSALYDRNTKFNILVRAKSEYPKSEKGLYIECLLYCYHDTLILQFILTKLGWRTNLAAGWDELNFLLRDGFDFREIGDSGAGTVGVSLVYWACCDPDVPIDRYLAGLQQIVDNRPLRHVAIELSGSLGALWFCEQCFAPDAHPISQNLWLLLTQPTADLEVNERFSQPRLDAPSDFSIVALAIHKIAYEREEFFKERTQMDHERRQLEPKVRMLVNSQRTFGRDLDELRSEKGKAIQRDLATAGAQLADYQYRVGLLRELFRTLVINQRVMSINAVAVLSEAGAQQVARSSDREQRALMFLSNWNSDEIFRKMAGDTKALCEQIKSDIEYESSFAERIAGSLQAIREQLQISGQRELGEIAYHLSIESAALVASIMALIAVEILLKDHERSVLAWAWAMFSVVAVFTAAQVVSDGYQRKPLQRNSVALTIGLGALCIALKALGETITSSVPWVNIAVGSAAALAFGCGAWFIHKYLARVFEHD